ncbi:MAG: hypothetical protein J5527_08790 [Treponema sp.]|nr:hypothetical protein [Treponema sp.]
MKRNTFRFLILSGVLSSFLFSLLSCSFEITEKKRISDPDLTSTESGITVTLKNNNQDTLYVNIYRQDVTEILNESSASSNPAPTEYDCIGIVFPYEKSNSTSNATFVYEDNYIITGHKYRYSARLYSSTDGYTYTNWTPFFTAKNGLLASDSTFYYYTQAEHPFVYNEIAKTITVSGDIDKPTGLSEGTYEASFVPALVFQANDNRRVFQIESLDVNSVIYLSSLLPLDFHDADIKLIGIVGQRVFSEKAPKSDVTKTQKVIWTSLCPIKLYDRNNLEIPNNVIHLTSEHGDDGFDYSY